MSEQPTPTERDIELISAYIDGMLNDAERSAFEARLARDAALQAELDSLRGTVQLVRDLPSLRAPRNFTLTPEMLAEAPPPQAAPRPRMIAFPLTSVMSAAAGIVVALAGVVLLLSSLGQVGTTDDDLPQSVAMDSNFETSGMPDAASGAPADNENFGAGDADTATDQEAPMPLIVTAPTDNDAAGSTMALPTADAATAPQATAGLSDAPPQLPPPTRTSLQAAPDTSSGPTGRAAPPTASPQAEMAFEAEEMAEANDETDNAAEPMLGEAAMPSATPAIQTTPEPSAGQDALPGGEIVRAATMTATITLTAPPSPLAMTATPSPTPPPTATASATLEPTAAPEVALAAPEDGAPEAADLPQGEPGAETQDEDGASVPLALALIVLGLGFVSLAVVLARRQAA